VQVRRAGARKPGDDDRPLDRLALDLRVAPEQILDAQPVREQLQHEPARGDPPERREIGVALERVEQHAERLAKHGVTVVGETRALRCRREQIVEIERYDAIDDRARCVERAQHERQPRAAEVVDVDSRHPASVRAAPPCEEGP
jgi:hypothetical protein